MSDKFPIAIIIGTRAELIKTFPIMIELKKRKIPYYFIHTGQHGLKDLCKRFSVKEPDIILTKEPKKSSKFFGNSIKGALWNLVLIFRIRKELKRIRGLKFVLYHGDTMTTASASIASSKFFNPKKNYKNVHLEAGLRSYNNFEPFPEEISRRITGFFSDILFAVSKKSMENLKKYENKKKIILVGNTIIDSSNIALKMALRKKVKALSSKRFALISIHRHENINNKKRLEKIVDILSSLNISSFFTMHDNTLKKLEDFKLIDKLRSNHNIKIIKPLDYVSFIYQISKCSLIVCDGGSLQEESLIFKKPCIILRKSTERQEGLETNFQYLSMLDVEKTKIKIDEFLSKKFKPNNFKNPYGEIGVSKKIVKALTR